MSKVDPTQRNKQYWVPRSVIFLWLTAWFVLATAMVASCFVIQLGSMTVTVDTTTGGYTYFEPELWSTVSSVVILLVGVLVWLRLMRAATKAKAKAFEV